MIIQDCWLTCDRYLGSEYYKKLTKVDEAKLGKTMSDHVELNDTAAFAVEKNNHWKEQKLMLHVAMVKEKGK